MHAHLTLRFGARSAAVTLLSLSSGSTPRSAIQRSRAESSYVRPVVTHIAGCDIRHRVMGHMSASGGVAVKVSSSGRSIRLGHVRREFIRPREVPRATVTPPSAAYKYAAAAVRGSATERRTRGGAAAGCVGVVVTARWSIVGRRACAQ